MSPAPDDDLSALLGAALAGDERAYAQFLVRAADLVRGLARRRIVSGGLDPEDIVQETLLAVHLKRHTWRQESPVRPWLFAIARYKLIDAFRRRGDRIEIDIAEFAETLPMPEAEAVSGHDIERVLEALAPVQRSVIRSISVEGRSIGETAASLHMKETAVRVALHRGLAAVARRFGKI